MMNRPAIDPDWPRPGDYCSRSERHAVHITAYKSRRIVKTMCGRKAQFEPVMIPRERHRRKERKAALGRICGQCLDKLQAVCNELRSAKDAQKKTR